MTLLLISIFVASVGFAMVLSNLMNASRCNEQLVHLRGERDEAQNKIADMAAAITALQDDKDELFGVTEELRKENNAFLKFPSGAALIAELHRQTETPVEIHHGSHALAIETCLDAVREKAFQRGQKDGRETARDDFARDLINNTPVLRDAAQGLFAEDDYCG